MKAIGSAGEKCGKDGGHDHSLAGECAGGDQ